MSFNWNDYNTLAVELKNRAHQQTLREAYYRSAISRAYYGALIIARNYLQAREGVDDFGDNVHLFIIKHFESSRDQHRRSIGNKLNLLRKSRNKADYENIIYGSLSKETENALKNAKFVIDGIQKLIGGRPNIQNN